MSLLQHHYRILGLKPGAALEDVKQAYRALAKLCHPDGFLSDSTLKQQAEERFRQISEAYESLKQELSNAVPVSHVQDAHGSKTTRQTTNPEVYYKNGAENVRVGLYREAIADFTTAIRLNPDYGEAYRYRGYVNSLMGFERRAEVDLDKAAFLLGEPPSSAQENNVPTQATAPQPSVPPAYVHDPISVPTQGTATDSTSASQAEEADACVHNPGSWRCIQTFKDGFGEVTAIALSRDGKFLAIGSTESIVRLFNLRTGKCLYFLKEHTGIVNALAFSVDGQTLVSASQDCTLKIWHVSSGALLKTLVGHTDAVTAIALSPDRKILVSGSLDGSVRFWQFNTGELLRSRYEETEPIRAVAISSDGQTAFAGGDGKSLKIYYLKSAEFLRALPIQRTSIEAITLAPDGKRVVTVGSEGEIKRWNLGKNQSEQIVRGHSATIRAVAWSTNDQILASGGDDNSIKLWKPHQFEHSPWVLLEHTAPITSLVWSSNSQVIISGSLDQTVKVWQNNPSV